MEKYVQSLLDRLSDDKKKYLLMIMDSAINEMHNNGVLTQLSPELMARVHDPDPQVRVTEKTSLAKSIGYSFVTDSKPGIDKNGVNHNITINNNEKFPASIAICIQGGLEGLYMSGLYKKNPSGKMNYNIIINSNNQVCSTLVGYIELLNRLYDEFNINIIDSENIEKIARALKMIASQENSDGKNGTPFPDDVKKKIEKQEKLLKILKIVKIQSIAVLLLCLFLQFVNDAFLYVLVAELIILIGTVIFSRCIKNLSARLIYENTKSKEEQQKTAEKTKDDMIVEKINDRQPNANEHKCSKCGNVQSKSISRCLRCSNLITEETNSDQSVTASVADKSDGISSRRWNELIYAANKNLSPDEVVPPLANDEERETYNRMVKELETYRKTNPSFCFSPVELDW